MNPTSGDNRPYHGTHDGGLEAAVPLFTRRVLVAGDNIGTMVQALAARAHTAVYVITRQPPDADPGLQAADAVLPPEAEPLPFPEAFFDTVVLQTDSQSQEELEGLLKQYSPLASAEGAMIAAVSPKVCAGLCNALRALDWRVYHRWTADESPGGRAVCRAYRNSVDFCIRARQLHDAGHPAWAYDFLYLLPEGTDNATATQVAVDSLFYLSRMPAPEPWPARLSRLARALWLFSIAASRHSQDTAVYHAMARICWETGLGALGDRLDPAHARKAESATTPHAEVTCASSIDVSVRTNGDHGFRSVLMLTRTQMDHGLDTLYDGLCELLGDSQVTEFPYKPSLHEHPPDDNGYYPSAFSRDGADQTAEAVMAALKAGAYDLILFGDLSHDIPRETILGMLQANPAIPVAILDQGDSPEDDFLPLAHYLERDNIAVYFKREKLAGTPYHPRVQPLPLAYPAGRIPPELPAARRTPLFWAGNRNVWMRQRYVEHLEQSLGTPPRRHNQPGRLSRTPAGHPGRPQLLRRRLRYGSLLGNPRPRGPPSRRMSALGNTPQLQGWRARGVLLRCGGP